MKKLGKVSIIARNGNLLVQSNKSERIGTPVVNQQIKRIGKIVDIIGPTKAPYIVVNIKGYTDSIKEGDVLYLMDKQPQKSKPKKYSRNRPQKYPHTSSKKKPPKK